MADEHYFWKWNSVDCKKSNSGRVGTVQTEALEDNTSLCDNYLPIFYCNDFGLGSHLPGTAKLHIYEENVSQMPSGHRGD